MSTRFRDFGVTYEQYVDTEMTHEMIVEQPNGEVIELEEGVYDEGTATIIKPDGTVIGGPVDITFTDRENATVIWVIDDTISTAENAGNWIVAVKFYNTLGDKINEIRANFNILE